MYNKGKIDKDWERLFNDYDILDHIERDGFFEISARQIKKYHEPRLMVKFDHRANLPKLFFENELAILPTTRGDYIISHFDAYHKFEDVESSITYASLPAYIQSLNSSNIPSEAIALNFAAASGIITDFMDEHDIVATVSGRMSSGNFSYNIIDKKYGCVRYIDVNNSQIEIDAAYEGCSSLALFEAKRDLSDDFLVRQLYYPFRTWKDRLKKPVRPMFLVYSNGIYRLYEYAFDDPNNYSSISLVKQKNYSIEETTISSSDIQGILYNVAIIEEPDDIPFPQADKFERVINLCELVNEKELSGAYITKQYDFDPRQTNYYTSAARYLGLLDKRKDHVRTYYFSSGVGRRILGLGFKGRQLAFCEKILSHKVFNKTLRLYFNRGVMPSNAEIVNIMKKSDLCNVDSDSTYVRRSSTIRGWINWIVSLIND